MIWALASVTVLFLSILAPTLLWLHGEVKEGKHLRDSLEQEQRVSMEYQHDRDVEVAAHAVTKDLLKQEQTLRAIAEAQRNEAQRKLRAYLARNLPHASEEEINEIVADTFTTPLSLAHSTALMRPGED